jgi:lysozyme family protein
MSIYRTWVDLRNHWEGGSAERPKEQDSGGLTNRGVTIGYWVNSAHSIVNKPPTREALLSLTQSEADQIGKVGFWDKNKIDTIRNPALRILVVDSIWMGGGLKSFGYNSIKELNRDFFATPGKLFKRRLAWLQSLSNWKYNGAGWTNRMKDTLKKSQAIQMKRTAIIGGGAVLITTAGILVYKNRSRIWR